MSVLSIGFIIIMAGLLVVVWRFKHLEKQLLADRQQYHPTMLPKQIRASRRFFFRSTIKNTPRLRWLNRFRQLGVGVIIAGMALSLWPVIRGQSHVSALIIIFTILCYLVGGWLMVLCFWQLNRRLIKLTTVPDVPANTTLFAIPQRFAVRAKWFVLLESVFMLIAVTWMVGATGYWVMGAIESQETHIVTKVSAANQNVLQIQKLATDNQKLTTRAKMTLFSMYYKDITNYDLDSDSSTYTYHVIHDKSVTWYVLMENSEDNGLGFYYLVKEDAQHRIQMYRFNDRNGDKTALHGLVPAYTPYYQTKVKLGQLTTAFMTQQDYQYTIKLLHPGNNWHY